MKDQYIYALGIFDGVHLGHQALLKEACRLAEALGCTPSVFTFNNHPDELLWGAAPKLITSSTPRTDLLYQYGISRIWGDEFNKEMMETPWDVFLERISDAAGFVCGSDFKFGARGEGTAEKLKTWCKSRGLACSILPQQYLDGVRVSSTHIRKLLKEGALEEAARFLGHNHVLFGTVVSGQGLGRKLGSPTANLYIDGSVLLPRHGVYACKTKIDGKMYPAVTNIGTRPTVSGQGTTVEAYILDFDGDLYDECLTLELLAYLRPEKKFDSLTELQTEIQKNAAQTRAYFQK